jgi:hypothetical protein
MKRERGKQTKLRHKRKGARENVNFEERKKRSDGGKRQEDRLRYLKR